MLSKLSGARTRVPKGFKKILAVQWGAAPDLHGQESTVAAKKAVENALENASLPGILNFIPKGFEGDLKMKVKVGVPNPKEVDVESIKKIVPAPHVEVKIKIRDPVKKLSCFQVVSGGLRWHSGIIIPKMGDPQSKDEVDDVSSEDDDNHVTCQDEMYIAVAAVRVGIKS